MKERKITDQRVSWDKKTNDCTLLTQFDDVSISVEPLTPSEAAQWTAEHKY